MKHKKLITLLLLSVLIFTLLSSCAQSGPEPSPSGSPSPSVSPSPSSSPSPSITPPSPSPSASQEPEFTGVNPLTGLGMDEEYEEMRPLAVMYNNMKAALPQVGVSKADIIYECLAEGGITRMIALFQDPSNLPPSLGSIRSTRAYFLDIAQGHDAILIHAGGSPEAYNLISKRKVTNLDGIVYDGVYYHRDAERRRSAGLEHSLFITSENLLKMVTETKVRSKHNDGYSYPLDFVDFAAPAGGERAYTINLDYSRYKKGLFEYDPATSLYMISQNDSEYIDGETEKQVGVTNILVLMVKYSQIAGDDAGRMRADLTSGGKGYYACGGKITPITWEKKDYSSPFVYKLETGAALRLSKGTTYINVFPSNRDVTYE